MAVQSNITHQLITSEEVIKLTFTNRNTDPVLIADNLIRAIQFTYVKPVLGEDYYDSLLGRVATSTETSAEVILLNDYMKPMLAYYVKHDVIPDLMANTSSAGVRSNSDDNSSPASDKQVQRLMDQALKTAARLKDQMVDFLDDNDDDFPDWTCADNDNRTSENRAGIFLNRNPIRSTDQVVGNRSGLIINDNLPCKDC